MKRITDQWSEPKEDDIPSPTQFSLRPTVKIAAQVHAIARMYPWRSKTEIINDLILTGLNQAIDEITGDRELSERLGEDLTPEDYGPKGRELITFYQEEKKALLDKVAEENKKKGGKG
jgi:hypothetical protein